MLVVGLHGFWGRGSDLNPLLEPLVKLHSDWQLWAPDLLSTGKLSPECGFEQWSQNFADELEQRAQGQKVCALGYSLGGRLLLHALVKSPQVFSKAVIVSAHPGIEENEERASRGHWESHWTQKFQHQPWQQLWNEWNSQEVLRGSKQLPCPNESTKLRRYLVQALENWSPTRHSFSPGQAFDIGLPLLWVAGGKDQKYRNLYQGLFDSDQLQNLEILPDAGHRPHLDSPDELAKIVSQFFRA